LAGGGPGSVAPRAESVRVWVCVLIRTHVTLAVRERSGRKTKKIAVHERGAFDKRRFPERRCSRICLLGGCARAAAPRVLAQRQPSAKQLSAHTPCVHSACAIELSSSWFELRTVSAGSRETSRAASHHAMRESGLSASRVRLQRQPSSYTCSISLKKIITKI